MRHKIFIITAILCMAFTRPMMAQNIAVSTDAAMDLLAAPSLGVEFTMGKKSTLALSAMATRSGLWNDQHIAAVNPEWRVYISGRPMYHHYIGAIGLLTTYKLHFADRNYHGDAMGAGLSFGYVLPVGSRWSVDFHSSLGYLHYHHKEFPRSVDESTYDENYSENGENVRVNSTGHVYAPLSIGIKVAYIIK